MSTLHPLEVVNRGSGTQLQVEKLCFCTPALCTYRLNRTTGEPPEDGEMNEITLPSRQQIRNSSSGGLRSSTLLLVTEVLHNINLYE